MMKCANEGCVNEARSEGRRPGKYCSDAHKQEAYRNRKREQHNKRLREQRSRLYIVPCSLDTANAFVTAMHRHNKAVPGAKFCIGLVNELGVLVGACIVGRPVARQIDDNFTLEVNRVVTDGTPNACSALYGAARKTAFDLGYRRLITYTLVNEGGSSMRGAGWKRVADVQASKGWHSRPGRNVQAVEQINKWRWETINPEYTRNRHYPTQIILPPIMQPTNEYEQLLLVEGGV